MILQGFLIDGYPLDEAQASEFINDIGPPSAVICLELSDEVATGRLSSRGNFDDDDISGKGRPPPPADQSFDYTIHKDREEENEEALPFGVFG